MSIILGIDPGLATVGFGVIEKTGNKVAYVDCGVIKTKAGTDISERLYIIKKDIEEILKTYKPDAVGVEELFFAKNVTNAIKVAQARGVILEMLYEQGLKFFNFTPLQVKSNLCGYGGADKIQVQTMVQRLLSLNKLPKPDDAADALAVALCTERVFR
jgi:crossover junction endodeoxyribonuclease RuvC